VVKSELLRLRHLHPKWGPKTLYLELGHSDRLKSLKIPKPSTIAGFLKAQSLVKEYQKHIPLANTELHEVEQVHEQWQLDAKGASWIDNLGKVVFINVKDVVSKVHCASLPLLSLAHNGSASADDYRHALRLAFVEFGMPVKIQVDHAGVFFDNTHKSPFPTKFHLWLISLGIDLIFSRKAQPKDQAIVERSHQTIMHQLASQNPFNSLLQLAQKTNERRHLLNYKLPCKSCQHQPPLVAYPQAKHSGRYYHPDLEESLMNLNRVYQYLEKGSWIRKVNKQKRVVIAGQYCSLRKAQVGAKVKITCCAKHSVYRFEDPHSGQSFDPKPIKNININELQGTPFLNRRQHGIQLSMPFC